MQDDELRRAFDALRAHDRASAPSFARMKSEAERRASARRARTGAFFAAAFAAAAVVAIAIWARWPADEVVSAPERPAGSLAFLLEPPSASVVSMDDPIAQIGEAW
jgi:hypothetical protein